MMWLNLKKLLNQDDCPVTVTIKQKLFSLAAAALLAIAVILCFGAMYFQRIEAARDLSQLVNESRTALLELRISEKSFLQTGDAGFLETFSDSRQAVEQLVLTLTNSDSAALSQASVSEITTTFEEYLAKFDQANKQVIAKQSLNQSVAAFVRLALVRLDEAIAKTNDSEILKLLLKAEILTYRMQSVALDFIRSGEAALYQQFHSLLTEEGLPQVNAIKQLAREQGFEEVVTKVDEAYWFWDSAEQVMKGSRETLEAQKSTEAELESIGQAIVSAAKQLLDEASSFANSQKVNAIRVISLVAIAAMGLFVAASVGLVRIIVSSLKEVTSALKDIAEGEGDLTKRITVRGNDELGEVAKWLNIFMEKLESLIADINSNSDAAVSGNMDLLTTSDKLGSIAESTYSRSESAEQVVSSVRDNISMIAASVEELAASTVEITQNAQQSAQVASEASAKAQQTQVNLKVLDEGGKRIGELLKDIVSIAEQTNLLALNATIEAARAGEAGKGFAVVANEVKELASQTSDLTEKVGLQVSEIQASSEQSTSAMEDILNVSDKLAGYTQAIAGAVEEQSVTISEVNRNISGVASGADSMSEAVSAVSSDSQQTLLVVGETREMVSYISSLTSEVHQLVSQFKFRGGNK